MMKVDQNTVIPLSGIAAMLACVLWINNTLTEMRYDIAAIKRSMGDQWTLSDMQLWEARVRNSNSGIILPMAADIHHEWRGK